MLQEGLAVERSPDPVGTTRHVGDDHVGVQVWILRAIRSELVAGRDEPFGVLANDAVSSPARDASLVLEVGHGGLPGSGVGLRDGELSLVVAEGVEKADTLRRGEDEVEAGHRVELFLLGSPGTRLGIY